jgi:hypothetical protein
VSAAADFLDTVDRYNDAAGQVQDWADRAIRARRDPGWSAGASSWRALMVEGEQLVSVAEPLQERLYSGELVALAAAEFQPRELPPEPVEREPVESVRPPAWGESSGRVAQLEREAADRQAARARTIVPPQMAALARRGW